VVDVKRFWEQTNRDTGQDLFVPNGLNHFAYLDWVYSVPCYWNELIF
jgi:hypothetical protein